MTKNILINVLLGINLCILFVTGFHFYDVAIFPYDITNGEGFVLRDAYYLYLGKQIYLPVNESPYIVANYTPLYPLLASIIMKIVGVNFLAARLLSVISIVLITIPLYLIAYRYTRKKHIALISGLFFLNSLYVYYWGAWARVDGLAALFSIIAIAILIYNINIYTVILSAICCILAFYTKQSALASFVSIVIYLFIKDKKHMIVFCVMYLSLFAVIFFILNKYTHNEFYNHIVTYNQLKWYPRVFLGQFKNFIFTHLIYLGSFLFFLYKNRNRSEYLLLYIYTIITLLTTISTGREGASTNYFIESIAVLSIYIGLVLNVRINHKHLQKILLIGAIHSTMVFFLPNLSIYSNFTKATPEFGLNPSIKTEHQCGLLNQYVAHSSKAILVENPGFAVINHKEVIGNAAVLKYLDRVGITEPSQKLIQDIGSQAFEYIIFQGEAYSYNILYATDDSYELVDRINCIGEYEIKAPKVQ